MWCQTTFSMGDSTRIAFLGWAKSNEEIKSLDQKNDHLAWDFGQLYKMLDANADLLKTQMDA